MNTATGIFTTPSPMTFDLVVEAATERYISVESDAMRNAGALIGGMASDKRGFLARFKKCSHTRETFCHERVEIGLNLFTCECGAWYKSRSW